MVYNTVRSSKQIISGNRYKNILEGEVNVSLMARGPNRASNYAKTKSRKYDYTHLCEANDWMSDVRHNLV